VSHNLYLPSERAELGRSAGHGIPDSNSARPFEAPGPGAGVAPDGEIAALRAEVAELRAEVSRLRDAVREMSERT
jgi:hypothetical protein